MCGATECDACQFKRPGIYLSGYSPVRVKKGPRRGGACTNRPVRLRLNGLVTQRPRGTMPKRKVYGEGAGPEAVWVVMGTEEAGAVPTDLRAADPRFKSATAPEPSRQTLLILYMYM